MVGRLGGVTQYRVLPVLATGPHSIVSSLRLQQDQDGTGDIARLET